MAASTFTGALYATAATSAIGLSVAVSKVLIHYPVLSAQAVRYAIGAAALLAVTRLRRQRLPRPTGRDLALLLALGAVGLAGFNILLLAALQRSAAWYCCTAPRTTRNWSARWCWSGRS
jgi:drug/metabolite transporter (DMT)-like permease